MSYEKRHSLNEKYPQWTFIRAKILMFLTRHEYFDIKKNKSLKIKSNKIIKFIKRLKKIKLVWYLLVLQIFSLFKKK